MGLVESQWWKVIIVAAVIFSMNGSLVSLEIGNVSRETTTFLNETRILTEHKSTSIKKKDITTLKTWLEKPETAHRAARLILSLADGNDEWWENDTQNGVESILMFQKRAEEFNPVCLELLLHILKEKPDFFVWENFVTRFLHGERQPFILQLNQALKRAPLNPFIHLALYQLNGKELPFWLMNDDLEVTIRRIDYLLAKGMIDFFEGKYQGALDSCIRAIEKAELAGDSWAVAEGWIQLGQFRREFDQVDEAKGCLEKAMVALKEFPDQRVIQKSNFLKGLLAVGDGDLTQAVTSFREMIPEEDAPVQNILQASSLLNLGYIYDEQGFFKDSFTCYKRILPFFKRAKDFRSLALAYLNQGALAEKLNMLELARENYRKIMEMKELGPEDDYCFLAMENMGNTFGKEGNWDKAIELLENAFRIILKKQNREDALLAGINLIYYLLEKGDLNRAEAIMIHCDRLDRIKSKGITSLILRWIKARLLLKRGDPDGALAEMNGLPERFRECGYHSLLWDVCFMQGMVMEAKEQYQEALENFREAMRGIETLQENCGDPFVQIHFIQNGKKVVEHTLHSLLNLSSKMENRRDIPRLAYEVMENYRARVLVKELGSVENRESGLITRPALEDVQEFLKKRRAAAMMVFEGIDDVYILSIDGENIRLRNTGGSKEIQRFVQDFLMEIIRHDIEPGTGRMEDLKNRLLSEDCERMFQNVEEIYILPDGWLYCIPLEVLPTRLREGKMNLFGLQKKVFYLPSWKFLFMKKEDKRMMRGKAFLGVFGSSIDDESFENLAWTRKEVGIGKECRFWDTAEVIDGCRYLDFKRSPKKKDMRWDIIHIAAHIQVDEEDPWKSRLVLGGNDLSSGSLTLRQLEAEKWKANMVILSGCSSGRGKFFPGEGIINIARAFIVSGSRSVLTTLWPVADKAACKFMEFFYTGLSEKKGNAGQALLFAKQKMWEEPGYHNPFYWAGFVLYGDPETITVTEEGRIYTDGIAIGCIVVILFIFLFIVFKRTGR